MRIDHTHMIYKLRVKFYSEFKNSKHFLFCRQNRISGIFQFPIDLLEHIVKHRPVLQIENHKLIIPQYAFFSFIKHAHDYFFI